MFENFGNLGKILGDIQQLQEELHNKTVEVTTAKGAFSIVANGKGQIVKVTMDLNLLSQFGSEVNNLVCQAINDALVKSKDLAAQELSRITGGLNIPNLNDILGK